MTRVNSAGVTRRHGVVLTAAVVLMLTLVLSGCGGRGVRGQTGAGISAGTASSGSVSTSVHVQDVDADVQSALGGLDSVENSATNADNMSQEGTTLP